MIEVGSMEDLWCALIPQTETVTFSSFINLCTYYCLAKWCIFLCLFQLLPHFCFYFSASSFLNFLISSLNCQISSYSAHFLLFHLFTYDLSPSFLLHFNPHLNHILQWHVNSVCHVLTLSNIFVIYLSVPPYQHSHILNIFLGGVICKFLPLCFCSWNLTSEHCSGENIYFSFIYSQKLPYTWEQATGDSLNPK